MGSKKFGVFLGVLAVALLAVSGSTLVVPNANQQTSVPGTVHPNALFGPGSLIVEPRDGMSPVKEFIGSASSTIDVVMYEFSDPAIEQLLAQEAAKGVTVRVILDNGYFGAGSRINLQAFGYLQGNGVQVHWSPAYFALTHQKTVIVDGREALVMTFNLTPQYYKSDRDFGVIDTDANDVAGIQQTFDADWNGQNLQAQPGNDLVWSPGSRDQLPTLIRVATSTLDIYNEEMQDPQTIAALESAAKRGVDVEVVMTYSSQWKQAFTQLVGAGVHVRTYKANAPLYIHAKAVIADTAEAFIGSENFSAGSLDQNRELGLIVADPSVVSQLQRTFDADRASAAPFLVQ